MLKSKASWRASIGSHPASPRAPTRALSAARTPAGTRQNSTEGTAIDKSTKRRLLLGFASNWIAKLANTVIQLIQVPVFFHFWATPVYGDWIILSGIPAYLAFSSVGFGNVASNEMTMLASAGNRDAALCVFQSCWWLIAAICSLLGLLLVPVLYLLPAASLLDIHAIAPADVKWIIFYLGISVLLGQFEQLIGAAYTCVARYPYGSFIKSILSLLAFGAMIAPVALGYGPRTTAMVYAAANAVGTLFFASLVRHDIPWIRFGWHHARATEIRRLTGPAFAFMGFPIGNAFNLQGTQMAVHYALGPEALAVFASARTVSRVALQMVQMVNNTFWPELSLAYGAKDEALLRTLHRRACQMALILAFVVVLAMLGFGPWFLTHWTGGHVPPSRSLLAILLFVVVLYALWSTSSTLATAINQHQSLAAWYVAGTGLTVLFTYILARLYGLYGAAASLVLSEVIMNIYVLPNSLRISRDTFPAFLASMAELPPAIRPRSLLARLSRSKPKLESQ
ncbi:MAG: polysaccharide biosynthesis C-terminal domain-containing protein [Acidobacteriota bacterium]|nr:polysaccharide biosynthesis C-terminal domain-containing protein [Acidobacteriota bacterium]